MSIHTIGDSHSVFGWENVISHHLGSVLCFSFGKDKLERCDIRSYGMQNGDTVIFCLGEIDCRCHVHKYITNIKTYQDIIDDIVDHYFDAIELNVFISNIKFKNVCVYNVLPPVRKCKSIENLEYPFLGSDEERKKYVLYFNKKLKEKCFQKSFVFFDVYFHYTDENGFLKDTLSDGNVHIGNGLYITQFLNKMIHES